MRRLLRRSFSALGSALCLLSLLACFGTAWLWWRVGRVRHDDAVAGGRAGAIEAGSDGRGLSVAWRRGYPAPPGVRFRGYATDKDWTDDSVQGAGDFHEADGQFLGVRWFRDRFELYTTADGFRPLRPVEWGGEHDAPRATVSSVGFVAPHARVAVATALPPLLWLGVALRRARALRRRRRLGLCRRCGYDLTGNTSGTCSECGEPTRAGGKAAA